MTGAYWAKKEIEIVQLERRQTELMNRKWNHGKKPGFNIISDKMGGKGTQVHLKWREVAGGVKE